MINPTWLMTFCTLVEQQHFTRTAKKLHMTQSGVSQHIKKLEQLLDIQLIVREGKSFSLTESGQKLYQQGGLLLQSFDDLEQEIKQDNPYEGRVKVCSPGSVGLRLYPFLLELQCKHQGLFIEHRFAPNEDVVVNLLNRNVDIGVATEAFESNKLTSVAIAEEPLVLVTASSIDEVTWQSLIDIGFIGHPDGAHHGKSLLSNNFEEFEHIEQFQQKGFSNQISLILEPVSLGLGFTVLPMHAVSAFSKQKDIKVHSLAEQVSETLYLSCQKRAVLPARVSYVKSEIKDYLRQLT